MTKKMTKYLVNKYWEIRKIDRKLFFDNINHPQVIVKDVVKFIQRKHVQAAIAEKDGKTIIFFLESNQFVDWLYNFWFRFKKTPYKETGTNKKIRAHAGFYNSYLLVRNSIHQAVKNSNDVMIMGHSLGAAIATFAALDLQYNFPNKKIECMTTGSPRVGNKRFINSYNKRVPKTYRYIYRNDIVTTIPLFIFGYKHVNEKNQLGVKKWWRLSIKDHSYAIKKKTIPYGYLKELG